MPDSKLIEIRNATIWHGSTCVFQNLILDIEQNERVAILGPNGSGKTTLLKAINRELYPAATETLADLGIEALRNTPLNRMSSGQQRCCLLARAGPRPNHSDA